MENQENQHQPTELNENQKALIGMVIEELNSLKSELESKPHGLELKEKEDQLDQLFAAYQSKLTTAIKSGEIGEAVMLRAAVNEKYDEYMQFKAQVESESPTVESAETTETPTEQTSESN